MLRNIFLKSVRDSVKTISAIFILLFLTCLMVMFVVAELPMEEFQRMIDLLPKGVLTAFAGPAGIDLSTPEGVLNTDMFTVFIPLILIGSAIYYGYDSTAKEEESRTLDLVLSTGISRSNFLIQKLFALAAKSFLIICGLIISIIITGTIFDLNIAMTNILAICIQLFLISTTLGFIASMIGTIFGKSSHVFGISSGIAIISYFLYTLEPFLKDFENLKYLSLFYYYKGGDPLVQGFHSWHWSIFIVTDLIAFIVALYFWKKRDLNN